MEIVVAAVFRRAAVARRRRGNIRDEKRVGGKTVLVGESRVLPIRQRRPGNALPEGDLSAAAGHQVIVITGETALAVAGDRDVVTARRLRPEDVVVQGNAAGTTLDVDGVAQWLIDRVVDDLCAAPIAGNVAGDENPLVDVGIDQVVAELVAAATVDLHACAVAVHGVALDDVPGVLYIDPHLTVIVDPVVQGIAVRIDADAVVVAVHDVLPGRGAVPDLDAGSPGARLPVDGIARHHDIAAGIDPRGTVAIDDVAVARGGRIVRQVGVADRRRAAAGGIIDVNARLVAVGHVVLHQRRPRVIEVNAAVPVAVGLAVAETGNGRGDIDAVTAVAVGHQVADARRGRVAGDGHAVARVVLQGQVGARETNARILDPKSRAGIREGQVRQGHGNGVVEFDVGCRGTRVAAVEGRDVVDGAGKRGGGPRADGRVAAEHDVLDFQVRARIDVDRIARPKVVGPQQGQQVCLGIARRGTRVAIVARGRGILVTRGVGLVRIVDRAVDVKLRRGRRNRKRLAARGGDGRGAVRRYANHVTCGGAARDARAAAELRGPNIRARRGRHVGNLGQFRGPRGVIELDRDIPADIVALPEYGVADANHPVGIEVGISDAEVLGRGQGRLRRVAVSPQFDSAATGGGLPGRRAGRVAGGDARGTEIRQLVWVVAPRIDELRIVERGVQGRVADRVQVVAGFHLPGVEVGERLLPPDQGGLAGRCGRIARVGRIQVVVVAGETLLAVGGHVEIVAAVGPDDVIQQADAAGGVLHPHSVARGRVDRVARHGNVAAAGNKNSLSRIAIDQVVLDGVVRAGGLHAHDVGVDQVELDSRAAVLVNAGRVIVDVVGLPGRPTGSAQSAGPLQSGDVVVNGVAIDGGGAPVGQDADVVVEYVVVEDGDRGRDIDAVTARPVGGRDLVVRDAPQRATEVDAVARGGKRVAGDNHVAPRCSGGGDGGPASRDRVAADRGRNHGRQIDPVRTAAGDDVALDHVGAAAVDFYGDVLAVERVVQERVGLRNHRRAGMGIEAGPVAAEVQSVELVGIGANEFEAVAASGEVAAARRPRIGRAPIGPGDGDGSRVGSRVDHHQAVRPQGVGVEDRLHAGLGRGRRQPVIGVVAGGKRVVVVDRAAVVDVVDRGRTGGVGVDRKAVGVRRAQGGDFDIIGPGLQRVGQIDRKAGRRGNQRTQHAARGVLDLHGQLAVGGNEAQIHVDSIWPKDLELVPVLLQRRLHAEIGQVDARPDAHVGRRRLRVIVPEAALPAGAKPRQQASLFQGLNTQTECQLPWHTWLNGSATTCS